MSKTFPKKFQILGKEPAAAPVPVESERKSGIYCFDGFRLDAGQRMLLHDGLPVSLTPKAFDTLLLLVEHSERLLSKDQMLDAIWPDAFVEEKTLAQNVLTVRRALAVSPGSPAYIETVPKRGYRFNACVTRISDDGPGLPASVLEYPVPVATAEALSDEISPVVARDGRRRALVALGVVLALGVGVGLFFLGRHFLRPQPIASTAFRQIEITRLTHDGNITAVGLSPDGKWAAFAADHNGQQSLSVEQLVTGTVREIVPPASVQYRAVTLSRDGQWVYYVSAEPEKPSGALFRVPLFGGAAARIGIGNVDSRVDLSPDGKQIAFVRWTDARTTAMMIANADGSGERQLAVRRADEAFSASGPAWSPDGAVLIIAANGKGGARRLADLIEVKLADGAQRELYAGQWTWIGELSWLSDGSGLVMTAWDSRSETMSDQVWLLSYPSGEMRRITSDINGYLGVTASGDGKLIAATQTTPLLNFWIAPQGNAAQATRITDGAGEMFTERLGLAWLPDGRLVYSSWKSGNPDIWIMNADGSGQQQLTRAAGADTQPASSPDGKQIVYLTSRAGRPQLWMMEADGSGQRYVADAEGIGMPEVAPDGTAVVFVATSGDRPVLWRVPLGHGVPTQLTEFAALAPAIAPDGESIACILPDVASDRGKIALVSFDDGHLIKQFDATIPLSGGRIRWSPDGKAIDLVLTTGGVGNIWRQPIAGGPMQAVTDWKTDQIFRFDWSRDGRLLAERGRNVDDVILIRDAAGQ